MFIDHEIARYLIHADRPVSDALAKISANRSGFLCVISAQGHALGMVTDGDIRRWLLRADAIDMGRPVSEAANADPQTLPIETPPAVIAERLTPHIRAIPLVDGYRRVVAIALPQARRLAIGGRAIGGDAPAYLIAEIGNNHQGDLARAIRLVDAAADAGVDCAKFQLRDPASRRLGGARHGDPSQDLGAQYTSDLLARFSLDADAMRRAFDHCHARGIEPLCTPWDIASVAILEDYGIRGYKLASADLTNHDLVDALAATHKPLICSTGMSTEAEIRELVAILFARGARFALLHTNSTYPTPFKDVNLRYMDRLAEIGNCPVGYSGHEQGWEVAVAAVARGACIVEKHITSDRALEGNDHRISLLPDEFAQMAAGIRAVEAALGTTDTRTITQGERMNREVLAKSLHAARDIAAGETITDACVIVKGPGQGLQPNRRDALVGRTARRAIAKGSGFFPTDIEDDAVRPRDFAFRRRWGLPVRWHDHRAMLAASNADLLEYHLSYRDMDVDLADWFDRPLDIGFVVHAPELFAGDHIVDLASADEDYRRRSIAELQRVIDLTRDLRRWHADAGPPPIVVNMGGFTSHRAVPVHARAALYARVEESLAALDRDGVDLVAQTMPPFPWHFGGRSFHNLFIDPHEIADFCARNAMRICLDVSHSQLACNAFHWSITEFIATVAPHVAHLHLVDAHGVDGEGLQIGAGNVDFGAVAHALDRGCPDASFVPEVWQGHKNGGEGFWHALDALERWFGDAPAARRIGR